MQGSDNISIALLTTGDEVVSGDILNKNASEISRALENNRFVVNTHLSVRDDVNAISSGLSWLLKSHKVVITTGGLGPTQDDMTIDAVAMSTKMPVIFNQDAWEFVQGIYEKNGIHCPENNKRLARFIQGSIFFKPVHGTAHGSLFHYQEHTIIILPGPTKECLPIINRDVIPALQKLKLNQGYYRTTLYLFQASESHVATEIEPICKKLNISLGFRSSYPYLEIKLFTKESEPDLEAIKLAVKPWLIGYEPIRYEVDFKEHWMMHADQFQFSVNLQAKSYLNWLPGWEKQSGNKKIEVSVNKSQNLVTTVMNGKTENLTYNPNQSEIRHVALIQAWLSMQWLKHLNT